MSRCLRFPNVEEPPLSSLTIAYPREHVKEARANSPYLTFFTHQLLESNLDTRLPFHVARDLMNDVHVRRASRYDLESICKIEDSSFSDPYPKALMVRLLREHPKGFLVAEIGSGVVVGYCVCSTQGKLAHLISIGVLQEYRRRKVATSLIQELLVQLGSRIREVWLEVNTGNKEAVKFYEGFGFRGIMIIENYYSDGSPALRMRLALNKPAKESDMVPRKRVT